MSIRRRDFVKFAIGTSAYLALGACRKGTAKPKTTRPGKPRYYVQLFLSGGHDPVYTTDPKDRSEVEQTIDLPEKNDIVAHKKLRLGAHFAPLAPWAGELCAINGVQLGTANHDTGFKQFVRLKTNVSSRMPTALDIIGQQRDTQPLGVAYMNISHRNLHSPQYFGYADKFYFGSENILDRAMQTRREDLLRLTKVMRKEAESLERGGLGSGTSAATAANLRQIASFFERVSELEPYTPPVRASDYTNQAMSEAIDRTLWLIEHDLARGVVADLGLLGWDTHIRNGPIQTEMNTNFVTHFGRFMSELRTRKNKYGTLAEQTVVVAGSDMGRFPILNDMRGKDHLPQTSFFFSGPGFARGIGFGGTGKMMEALPLSLADGMTARGNHVPILDDIGATVLHTAGLDPQRYGYTGKVLEFLLDTSA